MSFEADTLSLSRGGRRLISGLSFCVARGEALILRGPNGVGKTSLLRAIAGLGRLDSGTIRFDGTAQTDRDAWSEIAVLGAHADAHKAQLTIHENLAFWARIYGGDLAKSLKALDLEPIQTRLAGACSAGQRRRLGLARLVLSRRPLWLLDEPTVSLDAASVQRLSSAISAHLNTGGIAIIATHDTDVIPGARTLTLEPHVPGAEAAEAAPDDPFLAGDLS